MALSIDEFNFVRSFVRERSAVVLDSDKQYLVEARLTPLLRGEGLPTLSHLVSKLRIERFGPLALRVVDAMTTNETSFFRDIHPFEALRTTILPELIATRQATRRLTIWTAACSSGQEPYTIAMMIRKSFPALASWSVRILATDISSQMVARTQLGRYSQLEVNRGLPAQYLPYFRRNGLEFEIDPAIRNMVETFQLNLVESWPVAIPRVDVIFLRNVMIYFDVPTKKDLLGRMRQRLAPDGALFLGGAESPLNLDDGYERVPIAQAGCYRLRGR
ncbi:MAG: protein-glutamate O-methyltransferase CheR [Gemmatimonadales bacterium]